MGNNNCLATHNDTRAVGGKQVSGTGSDLNSAVLAATNFSPQGGLVQKLNLSFACEDLPDLDTFSKSDPFCILYKKNGNSWIKLGGTEVIHDNLNPKFVQKVQADYHFEQ